ncbi:MAG: MFS transporter [Verrucomicrobia bacterium]|nr:MFS transporter [Verrucomicrobiota bacterium]
MTAAPKLIGNNPAYERWRWQIFAVTWLAYAGFYLTRKSFAVAKIEMGKTTGLGLTDSQMSWIDGSFLTAYAIGQFFAGVSGDRLGTRRVILAGMLGSIVVAFFMGATSLVVPLIFFSGLQGLCQSTGWAPLTKNIGCFFSQPERGTVMGLWCTNYAVGGFLASIYAGYIGGWFGWRYAFYAPAATLALIWLLFFWLQRNRPEDVGLPPIEHYHRQSESPSDKPEADAEEADGSWKAVVTVLKHPMVLLLSAVYFFMKPTRYAIMFWAPKYLNDRLGTNMAQSGALGALFELAGPLSAFLAGVVSDKLLGSRRNPISVVCLIASAILVFFLDKLPATKFMLGACLFLIGFALYAPDTLVSGTAAIDFGTKKGASTAVGLINSCGSIGAIAGGTIPGFFHDRWGWNGVFVCLSASLLIAGLLLLPKWNAVPEKERSR